MVDKQNTYLSGHLLIATPTIGDERFDRTVIYICAHDPEGAMGIVLNKPSADVTFKNLLENLEIKSDIKVSEEIENMPIFAGGPVDTSRGFLVHSQDFHHKSTITVQDEISVTGTLEGIAALSDNKPPQNMLFALGYSGWTAGQLENEVKQNAWLTVQATPELVFTSETNSLWNQSLEAIGINAAQLSSLSGQA